jgi:predicted CxxxxCH...CXXCH cytochrome family protein
MTTLGRARGALIAAISLAALASCEKAREVPEPDGGTGVHPDGWADPESLEFHAKWFQAHRDDSTGEAGHIAECQKCHGADYTGGAVGVGCTSAGCHTSKGGPNFCGTCHGSDKGPMPTTGPTAGAHEMHKAFCNDCHKVPDKVASPGHIDGKIDVLFSGLAVANGSTATWDATAKTCTNVYCHAASTPKWEKPTAEAPCDFCHKTPPDSHARWAFVATPKSCANCHPSPSKPIVAAEHIDTKLEIRDDLTCWSCHGSPPNGAPAPALDGSTDTTSAGVGAHQRHLDPALPGRIGKVVACNLCHQVPSAWWSPGHILDAAGKLDDAAPAEVSLPYGGTFDAATNPKNPTCVVACHFDQPKTWTADKPGTVPACTSCHGFPPLLLRDGTPHTQSPSDLGACLKCHPFSPATHVDGTIDLLP